MKQILDVADNLERASEAVPHEALSSSDAADLQKQLSILVEGVKMTQRVLNHVCPIPHFRGTAMCRALVKLTNVGSYSHKARACKHGIASSSRNQQETNRLGGGYIRAIIGHLQCPLII